MTTRELLAVLTGLGVSIGLSYIFAIEPKTWESFLLVIPMIVVAGAVLCAFDRRAERE
ncbi:MAG: hypothetical protein M3P42_08935 [Actinomycetota bacterium]|nr:hypothetical protein [Actinomycetota bacterium]